MGKLNKGIKGRLRTKESEKLLKHIEDNVEVFRAVIERDYGTIEYDIYTAEYHDGDYITIDFNILASTFKEAKSELTRFKKEIYNHFGFKPVEYFTAQYDKVF